ncbi:MULTISPECIES: alpha/beta hydrolase [unclassified Nonomuraea]|uniref:alpha/beta fold hydrolase n=1 Tax=unclassified Nonomuraea TaxID=2593643 RepID=UPI0034104635
MKNGRITANGIDFAFVEEGQGPLALLLHGFPESGDVTYRHLIPALAAAGYRAVAPNMRGFAPTSLPSDGSMRLADLVADANALHEALGGDGEAVLVGHDWGAGTAWAAVLAAPERWARLVVSDVPPLRFFGAYAGTFHGIQNMSHFWFFQMAMADDILAADDMAFLRQILQERWTGPGYDATPDFEGTRKALGEPARLGAALALYRTNFGPQQMGTPEWAAEQGALWGALPTQPTLYLHGTEDRSVVLDEATLTAIGEALAEGSEAAFVEGAGHIVPAEKPERYNELVLRFLRKAI